MKYKGFTLIELIISLGLLAVIVGIGGDLLATILRAYKKAELFSLSERVGSYALTAIQQDIRSAISVDLYNNATLSTEVSGSYTGNSIRVGIPSSTSNLRSFKKYYIAECTSSSLPGGINIDPNNSVPASVPSTPLSGGSLDSLSAPVYVKKLDNVEFFTRIQSSTASNKTYDIVYVTFTVGAGGTCDNPDVVSVFQTSVNLRGGL